MNLLAAAGVPDSKIAGGFLWYPADKADWERFRMPLKPLGAGPSWQAAILWGAATMGHQGPDSEASGVWRPKSAAAYHEDDPAGTLVTIGGYKTPKWSMGMGGGIEDLLAKLRAGQLTAGRMYTAAIMFDQCGLTQADNDAITAFLVKHKSDVDSGDLVWANLGSIVDTWRTTYGAQANIYNPTSASTGGCPTCTAGMVCCVAPAACAGRCVMDCRTPGFSCPPNATCNQTTGNCAPR